MGNHWAAGRGVLLMAQEDRELAQVVFSPRVASPSSINSPRSRRSSSFSKRHNAAILDIERLLRSESLDIADDPPIISDKSNYTKHRSSSIDGHFAGSQSFNSHHVSTSHSKSSNHYSSLLHMQKQSLLNSPGHPSVHHAKSISETNGSALLLPSAYIPQNVVRSRNSFTYRRSWRHWILGFCSLVILCLLLGKVTSMVRLMVNPPHSAAVMKVTRWLSGVTIKCMEAYRFRRTRIVSRKNGQFCCYFATRNNSKLTSVTHVPMKAYKLNSTYLLVRNPCK